MASLTLIASVSPCGFGGTRDSQGTPNSPDFSGSGAGTVNAEAVEQLRLCSAGSDSPLSPFLEKPREFFETFSLFLQGQDFHEGL
ncbi:MAG: hypothetical protein ACREQ8_09175 [Woeseiaceae bacterium]